MSKRRAPNLKKPLRVTYMRDWRKHRNLDLEAAASRLTDLGYVITPASLSRIERARQPYNQPLIETMAEAYSCRTGDLITRPPGVGDEIREVWSNLSPENQRRALALLKSLKEDERAA